MKLLIRFLAIFIIQIVGLAAYSYATYQQQWFISFEEKNDGSISFSCVEQCSVLIWPWEWFDMMNIEWRLQGNWQIWFWLLLQNQIFPWYFSSIDWISEEYSYLFSRHPLYQKILKQGSQLLLMVNWSVSTEWITVTKEKLSFWWTITEWWKDFWFFDSFKPYTINLLRWPIIAGKSWNKIFVWLFIIAFASYYVFSLTKHISLQKYLLITICILVFSYDIRMWSEFISYYQNDISQYINKTWVEKTFRDREELNSFLDFVSTQLSSIQESWPIWFYGNSHRYIHPTAKYFLYPYDVKFDYTWGDNKVYVVYKSREAHIQWDQLLLNGLPQWSWKIFPFTQNAYLFIRN